MRIAVVILSMWLFWSADAIGADSDFFESDGVSLHYLVAGSGETVVLLHGFSGSAAGLYSEPGTLDALADAGYRVVALDLVGHGLSEKPHDPDRYGLQMVEDVRRLLDHLGVDKVHLAGYSMGSKVANTFRSRYPDRLRTIMLGGYGWPWQSRQLTYVQAETRLASRPVLPGNDLKALVAVSMGMHALTPGADSLRANTVPALGIIGDRDSVISAGDFDTLQETMANFEAVSMPGTHAGPDGAPYKPQYARELLKFLAQHD